MVVRQEIQELLEEEDNVTAFGQQIKAFEKWLIRMNLSEKTATVYVGGVKQFYNRYKVISKANLLMYKQWLIDNYMPKTVNLRINSINKYLVFCNRKALKLTTVKIQNKPFIDNVIEYEDYVYFIKQLKKDGDTDTYMIVKFLACTGARVSELIKFKVEHVYKGYVDMYSKGNKFRRIYIPKRLQTEAIKWIEDNHIEGLLFKNKNGLTIGTSGVSYKLKNAARRYKRLDINCIYPHSFRHLFAKCFLQKKYDLLLLCDLMGHSSVELAKLYARMSGREQQNLINEIVDW